MMRIRTATLHTVVCCALVSLSFSAHATGPRQRGVEAMLHRAIGDRAVVRAALRDLGQGRVSSKTIASVRRQARYIDFEYSGDMNEVVHGLRLALDVAKARGCVQQRLVALVKQPRTPRQLVARYILEGTSYASLLAGSSGTEHLGRMFGKIETGGRRVPAHRKQRLVGVTLARIARGKISEPAKENLRRLGHHAVQYFGPGQDVADGLDAALKAASGQYPKVSAWVQNPDRLTYLVAHYALRWKNPAALKAKPKEAVPAEKRAPLRPRGEPQPAVEEAILAKAAEATKAVQAWQQQRQKEGKSHFFVEDRPALSIFPMVNVMNAMGRMAQRANADHHTFLSGAEVARVAQQIDSIASTLYTLDQQRSPLKRRSRVVAAVDKLAKTIDLLPIDIKHGVDRGFYGARSALTGAVDRTLAGRKDREGTFIGRIYWALGRTGQAAGGFDFDNTRAPAMTAYLQDITQQLTSLHDQSPRFVTVDRAGVKDRIKLLLRETGKVDAYMQHSGCRQARAELAAVYNKVF